MSAREDFLQAMALWASSVALVTTDGPKGRAGITVSSLCSVTADDPALLVCIHRASRAGDVIAGNGPSASICCGTTRPRSPSSSPGAWDRTRSASAPAAGPAWPPARRSWRTTWAALDCRLVKEDAWGTHRLFIGEVAGTSLGAGEALIHVKRHYAKAAELAAAV